MPGGLDSAATCAKTCSKVGAGSSGVDGRGVRGARDLGVTTSAAGAAARPLFGFCDTTGGLSQPAAPLVARDVCAAAARGADGSMLAGAGGLLPPPSPDGTLVLLPPAAQAVAPLAC